MSNRCDSTPQVTPVVSVYAGIVQTSTPDEAFLHADVAILVGSMPRREGMERADLLSKNGFIFRVQGVSLVQIVIAGSQSNLGIFACRCRNQLIELPRRLSRCWWLETLRIQMRTSAVNLHHLSLTRNSLALRCLMRFVAAIPFDVLFLCMCLTIGFLRGAQNRAKAQLARRLEVLPSQIKNVVIWGNHSATQYPDVSVRMPSLEIALNRITNLVAWLARIC